MCELLGMSARHPATLTFSLEEFARHGGGTGPHADGWGVAWFEGAAATGVREPRPAVDSACARHLVQARVSAPFFVAHIRKATQGGRSLANTQPFRRELGGRDHVFAHNGDLKGLDAPPGPCRPVGDTDSEAAFCALLAELAPLWAGAEPPSLDARVEAFARFCARTRELGPANYLYCDGDALFAHGNRRTQRPGEVAPPGLHRLERRCAAPQDHAFAGLSVEGRDGEQAVVLFASVPLSDEGWTPLAEGEVVVARAGEVVAAFRP